MFLLNAQILYDLHLEIHNVLPLIDVNYATPLLYSIHGNHVGLCKYLLHYGANYNYTSQAGTSLNVFSQALFASKDIRDIFMDPIIINKIDFTYINTNMNNYANTVMFYANELDFMTKQVVLEKVPSEVLYEANIYKQNILHIMLSSEFKDDIIKYIDILVNKKICWHTVDLYNNSPITLLDKIEANKKKIIIEKLLIPNFIKFTSVNNAKKIKKEKNNDKIVKAIAKLLDKREKNDITLLKYSFIILHLYELSIHSKL